MAYCRSGDLYMFHTHNNNFQFMISNPNSLNKEPFSLTVKKHSSYMFENVYQVLEVDSYFKDGKFTQTLTALRDVLTLYPENSTNIIASTVTGRAAGPV